MTDPFHIAFHSQNLSSRRRDDAKLHRHMIQQANDFFKKIEENRLRYVGNGLFSSSVINLEDIHAGLGKSDAFVFLPSDDLDHDLKLLSMFVGVQTGDENMFTTKINGKKRQKPVLVVGENRWKPVLDLIAQTPYISDDHKNNIVISIGDASAEEIVAGISLALERQKSVKKHRDTTGNSSETIDTVEPANDILWASGKEPKYKVCVFCSASSTYFTPGPDGEKIEDDDHNLAFQVGATLAEAGYGVVSGAGKAHMMGDTVRGAQSKGGWTAGSNTPTIRQFEHVPDGINAYIDKPDIYQRMKVMIEGSDAFIIAPGGAGSIQEFLALMHYKKRHDPLMENKPVVILNPIDKDGKGYWDALITYAKQRGISDMFEVASTVEEAQQKLGKKIKNLPSPLSISWHELVERQKALDTSHSQAV